MCFSATASFVTAGVTGLIGIATIARAGSARELPLAMMPLIFAVQQGVEGALWLTLPVSPDGGLSSVLTHVFLVFALAFWPVFAPSAAWFIEPELARRRVMVICLLIGIAVAAYFIATALTIPHTACISDGHIEYRTGSKAPLSVGGLYLVATGIALLISSHRAVALTGWIIFLGSIASYYFYQDAFVSVWCFFAAASSIILLVHFERARVARSIAAAGTQV
jgi:hypothetical protein